LGVCVQEGPTAKPQRIPLNGEDARILGLETGPIRGHTLKVLVLEDTGDPLSVDNLRQQLAERLSHEERWRERLVPEPSALSGLAWQLDPDFTIARHVEGVGVDGALDDDRLGVVIADAMREPLARDRPLWTVRVVPRLADGRSAVLWKVHHCFADGSTVMRAGPRLLWSEEQSVASGRLPASPVPVSTKRPALGARLVRLLGYRGLFVREFRRVWGPAPLAGEVGPERAVAWIRCDLAAAREAGGAVRPHATINDVVLAAVSGSLRAWLLARGLPPSVMKAQVPVSMHALGGDERDGNRDSFLHVRLPIREPDPVARLEAVARATRRRKNRHDARAIYALRDSLSRAPAAVQRRIQHVVQGPHEYALSVSNVPGPRGPISVLGRHVEALYSFAEVAPDHGLRIAAVSLEGGLYLGMLADPQLVPALGALARGIDAEMRLLQERVTASGIKPSSDHAAM
jgi:WS/DGAT/MGAT family acyltransferase